MLEEARITADSAIGKAHYHLSRSCIRYIAMEEVACSIAQGDQENVSDVPLLQYAATSWVLHAKESEKRGVSQEDLLEFLYYPSKSFLALWVQVYNSSCLSRHTHLPEGLDFVHSL
jgi:hypothetical protein